MRDNRFFKTIYFLVAETFEKKYFSRIHFANASKKSKKHFFRNVVKVKYLSFPTHFQALKNIENWLL